MEVEIFGIFCFCINFTDQKIQEQDENCSKVEVISAILKIVFSPIY